MTGIAAAAGLAYRRGFRFWALCTRRLSLAQVVSAALFVLAVALYYWMAPTGGRRLTSSEKDKLANRFPVGLCSAMPTKSAVLEQDSHEESLVVDNQPLPLGRHSFLPSTGIDPAPDNPRPTERSR